MMSSVAAAAAAQAHHEQLRPNNMCETDHGLIELEPKDLCYIDPETARTLELVQNNVDNANRKHTLFGYLNANTSTTTGSRLLREGITRPLCHLPTLEHRLDCIEYLVNHVDSLGTISNCIRRFGQQIDLDAVVPCLVNLFKTRSDSIQMAEKRLDAITTLEALISQVPVLIAALEGTDEATLNIYKIALQDPAYHEIIDCIHETVDGDIQTGRGKRVRMFRIKPTVEPLFDVARSTYNVAINDLEQYVRTLQREDGLPWKLNHGESRGYYLTLTLNQQALKNITLPPKYIRVSKTRTTITCTTKDMMQSNVRASVSYENSMKLANDVLVNVLTPVMENISSVYKLVDVVGMLDLITSFAKLVNSSHGSLVRPRFNSSDTVITKARHPVLEAVLAVNNIPIVPNDVSFSKGHKNFMLVTGPNMGGKSVFLKQVALIQIMAQLGCYVPAESAHIKLMNRIVSRSGSSDDNKSNCSSFMWEMRGVTSALKEDKSIENPSVLYVIDEVGRGTSVDDGASYSFSIAEELALKRNCFTVFATHFDQIFCLTQMYGNIIPYHFKSEGEKCVDSQERPKLKLSHSLVSGLSETNNYGIKLAEACGLSEEVLTVARRGLGLQV